MKKILIFIIILLVVSFSLGNSPYRYKHKVIKETKVLYPKYPPEGYTFGCYKEISRKYDCISRDTFLLSSKEIDKNRSQDIYVNEYGDTILIRFVDFKLMDYEMNHLK